MGEFTHLSKKLRSNAPSKTPPLTLIFATKNPFRMLKTEEKNAIQHAYRQLTQSLANYRPRSAQREMIAAIANTLAQCPHDAVQTEQDSDTLQLDGAHIALIEGPTGVGKSLAYILAGSIMALYRGKKLIISSATIALQEQLVCKDLPFILEHANIEASFVLAKGRGRYLCPWKLEQALTPNAQETQFSLLDEPKKISGGQNANFKAIFKTLSQAFAAQTWNGDRDDFPKTIADAAWAQLTNHRRSCLKTQCSFYQVCPFFKARNTMDNADIIVANHDLVLADIALGGGVILPAPADSFYCFDEAHHLASKAIEQFASAQNLNNATIQLNQSGKYLDMLPIDDAMRQATRENIDLLSQDLNLLINTLSKNEQAQTLIQARQLDTQKLSAGKLSAGQTQDSITHIFPLGQLPDELVDLCSNLQNVSQAWRKQMTQLQEKMLAQRQQDDIEDEQLALIGLIANFAQEFAQLWTLLNSNNEAQQAPIAKWFTLYLPEHRAAQWTLAASPTSAAARLKHQLWQRASGVILTSATLRSLNSFALIQLHLGLNFYEKLNTLALASPFDYAKQGELYIPDMAASPRDFAAHTQAIIDGLPQWIALDEAIGTLVLFSSRKQLEAVYAGLPHALQAHILRQGETPKARLLEQHQKQLQAKQASIIFGLDSFAEGLDLPGELCVHVIIAKLPFSVPDDPVGKTRAEWIETRGGNPFLEITVPEASIKLIQAVGRLIRTEDDYGRVTILDHRLNRTGFGQKMLAALPALRRI